MSLIKHDILQPVRHFNMHDDPLTNIETLHIVLWDKGLCIAGYDQGGNVLTAKVYAYAHWDIAAIESVFINEPLVAGPQPVTHIWLADERTMIIPKHLYEQQAAGAWLRRFHFIEPGEQVRATEAGQGLAAVISYPVAEKLFLLTQKYFTEGKVEALSGIIPGQDTVHGKDSADLIFLGETVLLTVYKQGNLQLHQVTAAAPVNNLVYKIGSICRELGIPQEELQATVSGLCVAEELLTELKCFFPKAVIPGSEQFSSFTLLSKLISCAS
jgi:hypothetical protein